MDGKVMWEVMQRKVSRYVQSNIRKLRFQGEKGTGYPMINAKSWETWDFGERFGYIVSLHTS